MIDPLTPVTTADLAAALITVFEGCKLAAYQDSGGIWTVGIGHTHGVTPGMVITAEEAAQFFAEDQAPLLAKVADRPVMEAAALVSFGFNVGLGALEKVLAGQSMLSEFVHDHKGNLLPGLVARRALEETLINLSDDQKSV